MNHNELLDNLAAAKDGIFKNVNLGSPWKNSHTPKADLVIVRPSYTNFIIDIFEVKVTRGDLLADLRAEKWMKYFRYCNRLYFATLKGIASSDDIPEVAGWYEFDPAKKTWSCRKRALKKTSAPDLEMLQSLLFYRQKKDERRSKIAPAKNLENMHFGEMKSMQKIGKQIGEVLRHWHDCPERKMFEEAEKINGRVCILDREGFRHECVLSGAGHTYIDTPVWGPGGYGALRFKFVRVKGDGKYLYKYVEA